MSREKPQAQTLRKHPEEYEKDLNPNAMKGQNIGVGEAMPEKNARTAYDVKPAHRRFNDFTDAALKDIPILPEGSRLLQGAVYIDLNDEHPREFTATADMEAGPDHLYVNKKTVHYEIWNRLIGIDNPERTNTGNSPE
ncbi:MAG TPA: hypothetical protein VKC34_02305 [Blastocatellia bacterium]|nr:hypothetical protein [Blastocatellia bacterium]